MQVTRNRILSRITVITTAAAIAGICFLSSVSASGQDKAPAPQANTQAPETIPSAAEAAPTETTAGNSADVSGSNQAQAPKPGLTEEQIRAAQAAATQAGEPATAAPEAATPASDPAATTETPPQTEVKKPNPYADWKPPEMPEPTPYSSQKLDPEVVKALKERWGVELLGIRQSGAGMFLDFRFKVLDAEKSLPLFDQRIKPYLVAERSEIKLPIPQAAKVGSFRPTNRGKNIKADKTYYMLFANPDRHVKPGEKVSVVIGDFKAEHLTVQ